jgi:hypothetical protein
MAKAGLLEQASKRADDPWTQKMFLFKSQELKDKAQNITLGEADETARSV